MKLKNLVRADYYRDGGSYEAAFTTDDGRGYGLWLERSRMPDEDGRHHRWLFEYRGSERPKDCIPVVTGSTEEQELVQRLREFLQHPTVDGPSAQRTPDYDIERLQEMLHYILRREPCFPTDLRQAGFIVETP